MASSTGLEDTFIGTRVIVWDENDPLGFNSSSVDNIPLQKRSFHQPPKTVLTRHLSKWKCPLYLVIIMMVHNKEKMVK